MSEELQASKDGLVGHLTTAEERAGNAADVQSTAEVHQPRAERIARREALKKAATGAAVAGAVWAGPRVEGLSLAPDYAAAGTASGISKTFVIDTGGSDGPGSVDSDNGGAGTGCFGGGLIYGNDWAAVSPATNPGITVTSPQPNARNAAINMDYVVPSPPSSVNVDALIPAGWDADLNATQNVTMSFTVDPPWNRCRVNAVAMNKCDGNAGTVNIGPTNPASGANNPAPFSVNVAVPGPQPSNVAQVRITVGCT